jgi:hypothetical protein
MSLRVHGLVGIPRNVEIREVKIPSGWLLCLTVASPNAGSGTFFRYPATIWVPDKDKDGFKESIVGGSVFSIENGEWMMKEREGSKYPIPELKLNYRDFIKLTKPLWYKE